MYFLIVLFFYKRDNLDSNYEKNDIYQLRIVAIGRCSVYALSVAI